jgi:hypothetical protein
MTVRKLLSAASAAALLALTAGASHASEQSSAATPRYPDGVVRFDRMPNEKGYWDNPSAVSLVEEGHKVDMDKSGKLKNIADAKNVAPFQPWALALYEYRQKNNFVDDPMKVCIGPGNPRMMQTEGGMRILQDRNYKRAYLVFGAGNHGWRTIYMDGRQPPDPDEVTATFYGLSVGKMEGDALVATSIGFNTRFWFSNGGLPHTESLKLTERFTRPSHDVLHYEVAIDDPRTYTRPWKSSWDFHWVPGDVPTQFCEDGRK